MSAGVATPIEEAIKRFGSFVEFLAITQKVIRPGCNDFIPSSVDILLHPGGKMLDTVTRLHISIFASRNASSND